MGDRALPRKRDLPPLRARKDKAFNDQGSFLDGISSPEWPVDPARAGLSAQACFSHEGGEEGILTREGTPNGATVVGGDAICLAQRAEVITRCLLKVYFSFPARLRGAL